MTFDFNLLTKGMSKDDRKQAIMSTGISRLYNIWDSITETLKLHYHDQYVHSNMYAAGLCWEFNEIKRARERESRARLRERRRLEAACKDKEA